jgi:3'-5' exoribonuclease
MANRRRYLRDSQPGEIVQDVFIVSGKQFSATSSGKPFIKLFVSDRSASLTARMWNASRELFVDLPESGFVRLNGRVENYQNNLQLIVEQFWPPEPGSFRLEDLMPHTTRDIAQLRARLVEVCNAVRNADLRALLQAYLDDAELMSAFCRAPAASAFHHAFIGGLLEHTVNAIDVAMVVVPLYPGLNGDLVVAGLFLHDIAKTWELSYDGAFSYTDSGNLVGHIVKSAIWIEQKACAAEAKRGKPLPRALVDVLEHIVLSHHGTTEFGSPKVPATPEAIAVHMIENMDAKLMMALAATRGAQAPGCEGNWSEYIRSLSGRLYRPDVAPPDEIGAEPQKVESGEEKVEKAGMAAGNGTGGNAQPQRQVDPMAISNPLFETSVRKK